MRRLLVLLAAAAVLLTGCGFHGLYSTPLPGGANLGSHPYSFTIDFVDVLDLVPQSAVKVDDVPVGKVDSISLAGWHARVKVTVNGDVQLPANARAEIKQTSLLGEKYVSVERPADATGNIRDVKQTPTIPLQRTGTNPQVEEVLGAISLLLNGGGLPQIRTITTELNKALAGRTGDIRSLLGQLTTFVGGLDEQKQKITTAIERVDTLAATLRTQEQTLVNTLDTLPGALKILSDDRQQLLTLLQSLDHLGSVTTQVVNATADNLVAALKELDPVLNSLAAAGTNLPNALELLVTYPFPRNVVDSIHGDYVNLDMSIDLNLSDLLANLTRPSAGTGTPLPHLPTVPGTGG